MKIGVVFPQTEIGDDPSVLRDYIQTAEGLGYDYVLCYDHVLGANPEREGGWQGPYTYQDMFHEPFVTYAYMAAITQRIQFVTGILILPQRQTALVAKQAAQLDRLSGGRLRLGIGIGWNRVEYEALNEDFSNRGQRSEEQVIVLRELWTKPLVNFKGKYHTISDAGINPMPIQQPIPIWFGGSADAALRRMARLGDGWMPNSAPIERLKPTYEKLKQYLTEAGRDFSQFGLDIRIHYHQHSLADFPRVIDHWRQFGATHLCVNTMGGGAQGSAHIQLIKQFWNALHR
ncbi:MAG: LLM class F420-dependent oxidoreductase [Phototrophicales bacterium]|nr:MAG: LLM class F420-dependent oxidoreductase [Phototrophicales bacterium]